MTATGRGRCRQARRCRRRCPQRGCTPDGWRHSRSACTRRGRTKRTAGRTRRRPAQRRRPVALGRVDQVGHRPGRGRDDGQPGRMSWAGRVRCGGHDELAGFGAGHDDERKRAVRRTIRKPAKRPRSTARPACGRRRRVSRSGTVVWLGDLDVASESLLARVRHSRHLAQHSTSTSSTDGTACFITDHAESAGH